MAKIKKVILDVLKPTEKLSSVDFVQALADIKGVDSVDLKVEEVDKQVETTVLEIEGSALNLPQIENAIEQSGASLHSIDRIKAERG